MLCLVLEMSQGDWMPAYGNGFPEQHLSPHTSPGTVAGTVVLAVLLALPLVGLAN